MTVQNTITAAPLRLTPALLRFFSHATETIAAMSQGARCGREAERLMRLSDAELAKLGLTRDGIVRHAFQRFMAM